MGDFDLGRAYRMLATAVLLGWLVYVVGIAVDTIRIDAADVGATSSLARVRLNSVAAVAGPTLVLWLVAALGFALFQPTRRIVAAFGLVAMVNTLLAAAQIANILTAPDDFFPAANNSARVGANVASLLMSVTMLFVIRDRFDVDPEPAAPYEPVASEPVASEPVGSEPVGSGPVGSEPVAQPAVDPGPSSPGENR